MSYRYLVLPIILFMFTGCVPKYAIHYRPKPTLIFGKMGRGAGELHRPRAVASGPNGDVYVVDTGNRRIQRFSSNGKFIRQYGNQSQLKNPQGLFIDNSNTVYVADGALRKVQIFSATGSLTKSLDGADFLKLRNPLAVAVALNGDIYVVDSVAEGLIFQFDRDGAFQRTFGNVGQGLLRFPAGLDIDRAGNLYVLESGRSRIVVFNAEGEYLREVPLPFKLERINAPDAQVVTLDSGVFLVSNAAGNRVWVMSEQGEVYSFFGEKGAYEGQFLGTAGLAVDRIGNIYVSDNYNHRIQKFSPLPPERLQKLTFRTWISAYSRYIVWGAGILGGLVIIVLTLHLTHYAPLRFIDRVVFCGPRHWLTRLLLATVCIGAVGFAQYLIFTQIKFDYTNPLLIPIIALYGVGSFAFLKLTRRSLVPQSLYLIPAVPVRERFSRWYLRIPLLLTALALADWAVRLMAKNYKGQPVSNSGYIVVLIVILLWWLAWDPWRTGKSENCCVRGDRRTRIIEIGLIGLVLYASAFLRFYRIDQLPIGLDNDEAIHGLTVLTLMKSPIFLPYDPGAYGVETLHFYLMAPLFKLLGVDYVSMRIVSGIIGVLSVAVMALYLNRQFGFKASLLGSGFMGMSIWNLVYSRVGLRVISAVPWTILTFHFLLKNGPSKRRDLVLAGFCMGIGFYTYSPIRSLPGIIGLYFLLLFLRGKLRAIPQGLLLLLSSAMTALPMIVYAVFRYRVWAGRTDALMSRGVFPKTLGEIGIRAWDTWLQFYALLPRQYSGISFSDAVNSSMQRTVPFLGYALPALFTLGLLFCIARIHRPVYLLNLLWFGATIFPSIMLGPNASRQIMAMPLVYTFIGVAGGALWNAMTGMFRRRSFQVISTLVAVGCLAGVGYETYRLYFFERYSLNNVVKFYYCEVATALGREAQARVTRGNVVIIQKTCFDTTNFMIAELGNKVERILIHALSEERITQEVQRHLHSLRGKDEPVYFILERHQISTSVQKMLLEQYPGSRTVRRFGSVDRRQFQYEVVEIPAAELRRSL